MKQTAADSSDTETEVDMTAAGSDEEEVEDVAEAESFAELDGAVLAETSAEAQVGTEEFAGTNLAARTAQFPGHSGGVRDDVSGGWGSRKFYTPKGKGCYIELNNCPRHPNMPTNKPFADGWSHKAIGNGWFGPRAAERRCLERAAEYFWWCNGRQSTTVTATWRSTGKTRSAPDAGCWIRQFKCRKHPEYAGTFYDEFDGARSSVNQARCFQRAREYHKWCGNSRSITTTAEYRPTGNVKDFPENEGCFIHGMVCPNHPAGTAPPAQATTGYFRDHWGERHAQTADSEAACLLRAQQYHSWCGAPMDEPFTAEFKPTGRTKTFPPNLMAPIEFVEATAHGSAKCAVHNAHSVIVTADGGEGACSLPFSALRLPAAKSLAGQILSFDVEFLRTPDGSVGRHGGIYFGAHESGRRDNAVVDWIDRSFDRGYRVYGMSENNKWTQLTPADHEPHQHWTIIITENGDLHFRSGDITWDAKVTQHTLTKPHIGFWAYPGNKMKITNFNIRPYQSTYKFLGSNVDLKSHIKGSAQAVPFKNGFEIRSTGGEGAVALPMSTFGLPALHSLANKRISFDVTFVNRGSSHAGRHGGIFFGPGAASRFAGNAAIDWIEAGASRGYRLLWQMSNEKFDYWAPKAVRADEHWEVAIDRKFRLQFTAGDTNWMTRLKADWNDGFIGFWVYHGVTMRVQNVLVTDLQHDVCSAKPCQNGGACKADGADFTCTCAPGFKGADCSIALDRCTDAAKASCNGGKCVSGAKEYTCDCAGTGLVGKRCDGHKLSGWFRADNQARVFVDDKELIGQSTSRSEVVELKAAAKPGSVVTVKALNTGGKGAIIAWLKYRGVDLVTDGAWECSEDRGGSWAKATVVAAQGAEPLGNTANVPANAKYIWGPNAFSRDGWCRVTLPAQTFKSGDKVQLALKTTISAFCARSSPASTTTYYGEVCGNGGVRWTHYYTTYAEVRDELKGQMEHCARSRNGASAKATKRYFGDCDTVPTILSEHELVRSASAGAIKGLALAANPCADAPCGRRASCAPSPAGPFPFTCTCPTGYTGTGAPWSPCRSQDVCAQQNPCHVNAKCHKTGAGKFECRCKPGFTGDGKTTCQELDPCTSAHSPCHPAAKCKHTGPGKAVCSCPDGYTGNGKVCTEVDVCATTKPCKGEGAICSKTGPGTFSCSCKPGLVLDDNTCQKPDVCHPSPCAKKAKCTIGADMKPQCKCKPNYKGDGKMCSPINPCEEAGGDKLCGKHALCKSKAAGQHTCECAKGYKGDGQSCAPVDACEANPCSKHAVCKATGPGTYSCTCKAGYSGNGHHCKVADACDSKPCSPYATCTTTGPNQHTCTCKPGYSGDGTQCKPVDACAAAPCHAQAVCRMTGPGTRVCQCNEGYTGSGEHCEAINACKSNPCQNGVCTATEPGKYKCACKPGFTNKGSANPDICVERNNCNGDVSPCNAESICKVTGPGKHKCVCKWGYRGKEGEACTEIDRCAEDKPCDTNAFCQKTGPGTFLCTCNKHFVGDGLKCKPVNNCKKAVYPCHKDAKCSMTGPGTHECKCRSGFDGDGVTACVPHDNCLSNPCPANAVCTVTGPGRHTCEPLPGYAFSADRKATVEVDNCKASKAPCSPLATCEKTGPGKHKCTCNTGYAGDGVTCAPVDMCKTGPCDPRAKCKATGPGTFKCTCKDGHTGDGTKGHCDEINLCATKNPCHAHATCTKTGPGTASCSCQAGYFGDGKKCEEVDNCKASPFPCSTNAVCIKTGPAKHKCECKPGYKGDGLTCRYDTTEIDLHDNKMRDSLGRVDELMPKVNRVMFDGHDRIQDHAIGEMHDALSRVDKHVEKLTTVAQRTTDTMTDIAKAMKAVHDNTVEEHIVHTGPAPMKTGVTDAKTALPKIGDVADKRPVQDGGVTRVAAAN